MSVYLVQADAAEPSGWREVEATNPRIAAAQEAVRVHGRNFRCTVYVATPGDPRHASGAPKRVHAFELLGEYMLEREQQAVPQ